MSLCFLRTLDKGTIKLGIGVPFPTRPLNDRWYIWELDLVSRAVEPGGSTINMTVVNVLMEISPFWT